MTSKTYESDKAFGIAKILKKRHLHPRQGSHPMSAQNPA
jgi:hypothetical protein